MCKTSLLIESCSARSLMLPYPRLPYRIHDLGDAILTCPSLGTKPFASIWLLHYPTSFPVFFPPRQGEKLLSALSTWLLPALAQVAHFDSHQLAERLPVMPTLINFMAVLMPPFFTSSPAAVYALVIIAENQLLHCLCPYTEELCVLY